MRLIDADAMDEELFYKQLGGKDTLITAESAFNMIKAQPTAYDVEQVVAELEENGQKMSEAKGSPWDSSDHKYYKAISVKKAIGIVRKGGV